MTCRSCCNFYEKIVNVMHPDPQVIAARWAAPPNVHALTTTRSGGVSGGPYASMNPAAHVGDAAEAVSQNQEILRSALKLPEMPRWLRQVHGNRVVPAEQVRRHETEADGVVTATAGVVCAVLTADCLPLFLCDAAGSRIGLMHVGWRGLAAGIVEAGLESMALPSADTLAWLGPAIGPRAFEVGTDVYDALVKDDATRSAFFSTARGKWHADLYQLVRLRLQRAGVSNVCYNGELCTYSQPDRFFSYRRDRQCGRMVSLIWRSERIVDPVKQ